MNRYQQKWIALFGEIGLRGWKIEPRGNDIFIDMPHVTDLKVIRDNIPDTIAAMSFDICEPRKRLKFVFHNGFEVFEYLLNPSKEDLPGA
jgi:hypothetical protein